jgi:hypothetical protein
MVSLEERETTKCAIRKAFAAVSYPGDWCLRDSCEGDEPYLLEEEFRGRQDWQTIDAEVLDNAPDGYASALCFFSDEAFRFYLPAYSIADMDGKLQHVEPVFHLTRGLERASRNEKINPLRYGERTWFDYACYRFSVFNTEQAQAIVAYLRYKLEIEELPTSREEIENALQNYWLGRAKAETARAGSPLEPPPAAPADPNVPH